MTVQMVLAQCEGWKQPRRIAGNPFRLVCRLSEPANRGEVEQARRNRSLPREVEDLWRTCREAELFIDVDYGQWGLRLLSPEASEARTANELEERPGEFLATDIVIGEFLGDQDLVVIDHRGHVRVALPLDPRADWPQVAENLTNFLLEYVTASGTKYWESKGS